MICSLSRKPFHVFFCCIFITFPGVLLFLIVLSPHLALECAAQSDTLFLADPAFSERQRPGVLFNHSEHMIFDCTDCHHVYENGRNVWEYGMETTCSACHEPDDRGGLGLRRAWHGQCLGCHEKQGALGKSVPVMCGGCHVRIPEEGRP